MVSGGRPCCWDRLFRQRVSIQAADGPRGLLPSLGSHPGRPLTPPHHRWPDRVAVSCSDPHQSLGKNQPVGRNEPAPSVPKLKNEARPRAVHRPHGARRGRLNIRARAPSRPNSTRLGPSNVLPLPESPRARPCSWGRPWRGRVPVRAGDDPKGSPHSLGSHTDRPQTTPRHEGPKQVPCRFLDPMVHSVGISSMRAVGLGRSLPKSDARTSDAPCLQR